MAFFDFLKKSTKAPEERNYVDYRMGLNLNPKTGISYSRFCINTNCSICSS